MPSLTKHQQLAAWAAFCSGRVLPIFEADYPHDVRPRKAIEAAILWRDGKLSIIEAREFAFAAHAAAREAANPAAIAASRSAGHAAASAHVAAHAFHAASYALKAVELSLGNAKDEEERQAAVLPSHLHEIMPRI